MVEKLRKQPKTQEMIDISFSENEWEGVSYSYDDVLMVTLLLVINCANKMIVIENESSIDILFCDALKMDVKLDSLKPIPMPLKGLSGEGCNEPVP